MATSFFGGSFFGGEFFNQGTDTRPRPDDGPGKKTLTIKGRSIYKPTGLLERRIPQGRKSVDERAAQAEQIAREVARAILEVPKAPTEISEMTMQEVDSEIGLLLRKKVRSEEDELILLLLMAASAAC